MTTSNIQIGNVLLSCCAGLLITACGESDLVDLQEQQLSDAIAQQQQPPSLGEAMPEGTEEQVAEGPVASSLSLLGYELVFSDEFDSTELDFSKWDTAIWTPDTIIYDQLQYFVDVEGSDDPVADPFSFNGQELSINASETPSEDFSETNRRRLSRVLLQAVPLLILLTVMLRRE